MPFNLGPAELIIIMALALLVFGPKKLPEIGRGLGNALREFSKARNDLMHTIHSEMDRDEYRPLNTSPYASEPALPESAPYPEPVSPPDGRRIEYPTAFDADSADALPFGGDFHAAAYPSGEGDAQPALRVPRPDPSAAAVAAGVARIEPVDHYSVSPNGHPAADGAGDKKG